MSSPGGRVWVAVTREFERDNCVTSEILQSDWTIPNRAGVPRKSTKVPRPSFVRESREGLGPRLATSRGRGGNTPMCTQQLLKQRYGFNNKYQHWCAPCYHNMHVHVCTYIIIHTTCTQRIVSAHTYTHAHYTRTTP